MMLDLPTGRCSKLMESKTTPMMGTGRAITQSNRYDAEQIIVKLQGQVREFCAQSGQVQQEWLLKLRVRDAPGNKTCS